MTRLQAAASPPTTLKPARAPQPARLQQAGMGPGLRRDDGEFVATGIIHSDVIPAKAGTHANLHFCGAWVFAR